MAAEAVHGDASISKVKQISDERRSASGDSASVHVRPPGVGEHRRKCTREGAVSLSETAVVTATKDVTESAKRKTESTEGR